MSDWIAVHVGFENDHLQISDLDVWRHEWRRTGSSIQLAHPAYPKQSHRYDVYEIGDPAEPVMFAVAELSNGVWGFYVPERPQAGSRNEATRPSLALWLGLTLLVVILASLAALIVAW